MDRYDPFESMDRMLDQMRRTMWTMQTSGRPMVGARRSMALPEGRDDLELFDDEFAFGETSVRLERTDEGYVAIADIPGFEREEITVSFDDGFLSIEALHDASEDASEDDEMTVRRHTRRVSESISVPGVVDVEGIHGTYRNGVLEVTLPTRESPDDAHVIDIE